MKAIIPWLLYASTTLKSTAGRRKNKGSKGVLNQQEVQHTRKGNIDVVFVKTLGTIGIHAKMVIQMTRQPY
jgi:hypothetical protein